MRRPAVLTLATVAAAAALAVPLATATTAVASPGTRSFTEVEAGSRLSTTDNRYEDVYRIKSSPEGEGTVIRDSVLSGDTFPASGTDTAVSYFKDGRLTATESFTLGPPLTDGIGAISGTGKCTKGSEVHQFETCDYRFSGSYDLITGITQITLKGTETPAAGGKPSKKKK